MNRTPICSIDGPVIQFCEPDADGKCEILFLTRERVPVASLTMSLRLMRRVLKKGLAIYGTGNRKK